MNYTYMLRCADGSLYTGWTNDLERRLEAHNAGKGARYTRSRRPVELVYYDVCRINRKAVYSRGKSRAISQKQLILADFAKFRHCNNAYSRWNAGAFQREVQGFGLFCSKPLHLNKAN